MPSTQIIDVAFAPEVTPVPAPVLFRPGLLQPTNGRRRKSAGVLAEQCDERLLEVAGRDPLEIEDRDQHFETLRSPRIGRKDRRRKANALGALANPVTNPRAAHGDRTNAGHDLALGQISVAYQPLVTITGQLVGMAAQKACYFRLDSVRQQRSRAAAQNLGQGIGKNSWLAELENVSIGHGVS